jgi:hypothetical protein
MLTVAKFQHLLASEEQRCLRRLSPRNSRVAGGPQFL